MAINLGSAYGKVAIDSSGVKKGVDDGIQKLQQLQKAGELIGGALQKVGAGLTLGVTVPVVAFFKASIDSAMESQNRLTELNAVIKSTGGAAGVTADQVTKMAAELQKVTKFADDDIIKGQSMLLTFTKIGKDVFPQATEAMLNMAEKFGSIDEASVQLGKALNDPVQGVSALRRVGVMLSDQQEQQIKDFMAVNDIASAQKVILGELETEFGGLARAAGQTASGKMAQLKNSFDDLKESVGNELLPVLVPLVQGLTKLVEIFSALPAPVKDVIIVLMLMAATLGPILAVIGTIVNAVTGISAFVTGLSGLGISLAGVSTAFSGMGVAGATAFAAIGAAALPILVIIAALIFMAGVFAFAWSKNLLGIRDIWNTSVKFWTNIYKAFIAFVHGDTEGAVAYLKQAWQTLVDHITNVFGKLSGWHDAWTSFLNWVQNAVSGIISYLSNAFAKVDWSQVGRYVLFGIANGMLFGLPSLLLIAQRIATSLLSQIKASLGIRSPSKAFEQLGLLSGQGFQVGLARAMNPNDIARTMARPVSQMSNSQQQNITMNFAGGLSMQQVQGMIAANNELLLGQLNRALGGV